MTRLEELKFLIETCNTPIIYNASSGSDESKFYWNDIQKLGWASKYYTHDSSGEVDGWIRTYSGPQPIWLETHGAFELKLIKPGDTI